VLHVHLVAVLHLLARSTQVLLHAAPLRLEVLEEDDLDVVLHYCLVVAVLRAVVLLVHAVELVLSQGLGRTQVLQVLVLLDFVDVQQFVGLVGPLLEQPLDRVHLLEVELLEELEFVVVEPAVAELAAAEGALEDLALAAFQLLLEVPVGCLVAQEEEALDLVVEVVRGGLLE
jgi:hypothetical protein